MNRLGLIALSLTLCLQGCYYTHVAKGEYDLLAARRPIAEILQDPQQTPALKQRLQLVLDARSFAARALQLPDNGSYTSYVDVKKPYVVWNVFAAPELSLEPVTHCFWFAGCVAYQGFFDEADARDEAASLKADGNEVFVAGVPAYSTLGWFDDPILSTMLRGDDDTVISTVFHELAHQRFYLKGDTAFNESFASFVGEEGLHRYLLSLGRDSTRGDVARAREDRFVSMILETRGSLQRLYRSHLSDDQKRARKQAAIERLRKEYAALRATDWKDFDGYDRWFAQEINNARLLPFGLYHEWVPAFAQLFEEQHGDWTKFYQAVEALGDLSASERTARLRHLLNLRNLKR